jgi:hypothetical protein
MAVLTLAEARALITTALGDSDLQAVIDREEAWLARRVGALSGSRSETFYTGDHDGPLLLRRPTSSVTVTDGGVAVDSDDMRLLRDGTVVERVTTWQGPIVVVTYTPNDAAEVDRVLVELVRTTLSSSLFVSERIGDYSYQRGGGSDPVRQTRDARLLLIRDLIPHRGPGTVALRSAAIPDRIVSPVPA